MKIEITTIALQSDFRHISGLLSFLNLYMLFILHGNIKRISEDFNNLLSTNSRARGIAKTDSRGDVRRNFSLTNCTLSL